MMTQFEHTTSKQFRDRAKQWGGVEKISASRRINLPSLAVLTIVAVTGCGGGGGTTAGNLGSAPLSVALKSDPLSTTPSMDLSSATATVKLSKVSVTELQASVSNSAGESVSMWLDTASGTAVVRDTSDGSILAMTRTPDFTTVVVYANDGSFVSGALKYISGVQAYVAPMSSETDTDPRDHASDSIAVPTPADGMVAKAATVASLTSRPRAAASSIGGSCYSFISGLTSDPASYAGEAADALGETGSGGRVSKVAKLLSTIWSKAPSLCPDAPGDPSGLSNDAAYVIAVYDQALDGNWNDTVDKVGTLLQLKQLIEDGVAKAQTAIANGWTTTSESVETLDPVELTGTTADAKLQIDVGKVYFAQTNCLTNGVAIPVVTYDANGYTSSFKYRHEFTNGCAYPIQLAYCSSTATGGARTPRCTPYLRDEVAAGQTWSNLGREEVNDTNLVVTGYTFTQCPLTQDGLNVWLDTSKTGTACYYYQP